MALNCLVCIYVPLRNDSLTVHRCRTYLLPRHLSSPITGVSVKASPLDSDHAECSYSCTYVLLANRPTTDGSSGVCVSYVASAGRWTGGRDGARFQRCQRKARLRGAVVSMHRGIHLSVSFVLSILRQADPEDRSRAVQLSIVSRVTRCTAARPATGNVRP